METTIQYTDKTPNLATEKAFSTDFPVDHVKGARRTNLKSDVQHVTVNPIDKSTTRKWNLDTNGFCILHHETHLDPEKAYHDKKAVQDDYYRQIEAILHEHLPQYSRVECFDLTVRKRDPDFPERTRVYRDAYEQPSPIVHCDYSRNGSLDVLKWCFPGNDDFWAGKEYDILNVWRPLRESTDDWPLAVCDFTTVNQDEDILLNDAIRRDRVEEICLLHYNPAHRWYYLKNQGVDDLLVFRHADSSGTKARAFHSAAYNPDARGPPRESVEVRLVGIY
ncbi:putative CmcJ-like methyltransferase [Rhypophila decipiens]